jgi:hypothetical protein
VDHARCARPEIPRQTGLRAHLQQDFSAGEGFSFVLQAQKRATLVGEATVGGSGTIEFKPIDGHFTVVVPTGRVTSPATGTDFVGREWCLT